MIRVVKYCLMLALWLPLFGVSACMSSEKPIALDGSAVPVPGNYFGMHIHEAAYHGLWPPVPFGAWRLSDTGVVWPDLEGKKGEWRFERLDRYVALAERHQIELLLPLGFTPRWASARPNEPSAYKQPGWAAEPRAIEDWRRYVRTVALRYKGRLKQYEIWNEPNDAPFYSGTIDKLVELTRAASEELKAVDPDIVLVSPSFVGPDGIPKLDEFLEKGGGRYVDVVGFHFYFIGQPPEAILPLVKKVRRTMVRHDLGNKPLWNTEIGWLIDNSLEPVDPVLVGFPKNAVVLSQTDAAATVARTLILGWAAGIQRTYLYAWDNRAMGFSEAGGKHLKPVARDYERVVRWLRDSVVTSCNETRAVWVCQLSRGNARRAWIVWSEDGQRDWSVPSAWRATDMQGLSGKRTALSLDQPALRVGPSPLLLESDTWQQAAQF